MTVSLDSRSEGNKATDGGSEAGCVSNTDNSKVISTLDIASQDITENMGVIVTQGSATGILKTALTGAATSVDTETTAGVTFDPTTEIDVIGDIDGTGVLQESTGFPGIHRPHSRHKTLMLGLVSACAILLFYAGSQCTSVARATVTTKDLAAVRNNSSNVDVRNMRTFTTKNCKLSSLSSPSIILALLFSMFTVCNSSSCTGCADLVGATSGIVWDDGEGYGCAAYASENYCPEYGADDYGEGAANDKW